MKMTRAEFDALGIKDRTIAFQQALCNGEIEKAEKWLKYVAENPAEFSRGYGDSWFSDRRMEIDEARIYGFKNIQPTRTKEEAKKYLRQTYGFSDTKGFQQCLARGKAKLCMKWLEDIVSQGREAFPQYHMTWNHWKKHREQELADAKMT